MTRDNVGGGIKSDEAGIEYRLSGVIPVLRVAINSIIESYGLKLPDLATIDYDIAFGYQESGFGLGINVKEK